MCILAPRQVGSRAQRQNKIVSCSQLALRLCATSPCHTSEPLRRARRIKLRLRATKTRAVRTICLCLRAMPQTGPSLTTWTTATTSASTSAICSLMLRANLRSSNPRGTPTSIAAGCESCSSTMQTRSKHRTRRAAQPYSTGSSPVEFKGCGQTTLVPASSMPRGQAGTQQRRGGGPTRDETRRADASRRMAEETDTEEDLLEFGIGCTLHSTTIPPMPHAYRYRGVL
mmetsp:Transcript_18645/g.58992  ORF Transcript_18645/g.58992 Transcript_18645/m.58992 type:complete len:228 (-) Transcript_18645:8-691(-)